MSSRKEKIYKAYIVSRRIALRIGLEIYTPYISDHNYTNYSFLTNKGIWYIGNVFPLINTDKLVATVTEQLFNNKSIITFTLDELQFDIFSHVLFSPHFILSKVEKNNLEKRLDLSKLPKILISDIAVRFINAKLGDVIKIHRKHSTVPFFRLVVNTL